MFRAYGKTSKLGKTVSCIPERYNAESTEAEPVTGITYILRGTYLVSETGFGSLRCQDRKKYIAANNQEVVGQHMILYVT